MTTALMAARIGDQIGHTCAMSGLLAGLAIGFIAAVAVVAIVGTGGVAAIAIGGILAGTAGGGLAGMAYGETKDSGPKGPIMTGSPDTFLGSASWKAARATIDKVQCGDHSQKLIAQGSIDVFINMKPAARKTDGTVCSGKIRQGQPNVFFGGETGTYLEMESEVPGWLVTGLKIAMWVGVAIATCGAALTVGIGAALGGLAGGFAGGWLGGMIGGEIGAFFGDRMLGEIVGGFFGSLVGGGLGARGGAALEARLPTATLARMPGASEAHINARQSVAREFYNNSPDFNPGGVRNVPRIEDHMSGIDFTRPVSVRTITEPTTFSQYQTPGGRVGNYIAKPGTPANELGIGPLANNGSGGSVPKVIQSYEVPAGTRVLQSTASPKNDSWSLTGTNQGASGGATQNFIGESSVLRPIGGQQPANPNLLQPGAPLASGPKLGPGNVPVMGDGVFVAPSVGGIGVQTGGALGGPNPNPNGP